MADEVETEPEPELEQEEVATAPAELMLKQPEPAKLLMDKEFVVALPDNDKDEPEALLAK